jgi:hypothetical protein
VPAVRREFEMVACPELSNVAVPIEVAPSKNVTVPVGVVSGPLTLAVKVTD